MISVFLSITVLTHMQKDTNAHHPHHWQKAVVRGRLPQGRAVARIGTVWPLETQAFIAGLRRNGLTAPWVIDGALDCATLDAYIKTQLAPTLRKRDVVILDCLRTHNSDKAAASLKERGA